MKKNRLILLFLVCVISCSQKKANRENTHSLYRYSRFVGSNNGYVSYTDHVVIDNYEDNSLTIKQLYYYAKNYIDTVKADRNVSDISFIGKRIGRNLPEASGWDNSPEQRKYFVASFSFDNGFKQYANDTIHDLTGITIWKNSEPNIFLFLSRKSPNFYRYEKKVDSLLNCPIPVNTGF